VLSRSGRFDMLPACTKAADLMKETGRSSADLLLLDLTPEITFDLLGELRRTRPHLHVVLWVISIAPEVALDAMALGVRGILRKTLPAEVQVRCLERVAAGKLWFEKSLTDKLLVTRPVSLNPRENWIVSLLSQGMKNKEIATALGVTEGAVKVYLSRLYDKVGVKDRFELALYGLKRAGGGCNPASRRHTHIAGIFEAGMRVAAPEQTSQAVFQTDSLPHSM
jgi:DNA-binding NarL/FixJ family response regulator